MAGKIRTREKCPNCHEKFTVTEDDIFCLTCKTRPESFYIYLYWQYEPDLGKDHKITRDPRDDKGHTLDSFKRAKRLLEHIRFEIEARTFVLRHYLPKAAVQFRGKVLFPKWLNFIKNRKRALNYTRKLDQYTKDHFIPKLGDKDMTTIKTNDISDFRNYLFTLNLSPKTIKNIMDQVKSFCKWLYREELITRIPIFDPVEIPETLPEIMCLEDRRKVFAAIKSKNLYNALSFYAYHPVRSSEVCALDVRHFDLKYMSVKIENGLDYDHSIKTRKNKKEYYVPLSKHFDTSCIEGRFPLEIAFPNKDGKRYNAHTLNEGWKTACKRAGVEYVNVYNAMKHSQQTDRARQGASESQLEQLAGQSSRGMSKKYILASVETVRHLVDNVEVIG